MSDQPFTDGEVELIAAFANLHPDQIRGIAWLAVMKLGLDPPHDGFDRSGAHNDGDPRG